MQKIQRILDWLDESASGVIRLAYLFAGITAVAAYFGASDFGSVMAALLHGDVRPLLPWVLAFAVEVNLYLIARRVLASWVALQESAKGSKERDAAKRGLQLYIGILVVLLAFSCYNQLEYLSATWTPPHTALTLPAPWPFLLRALVTPALFMLAAFLAPLAQSLAQSISDEAKYLTRITLEAARRQWRGRLQEMERNKENITVALVNLVEDPQERHAINTIQQALYGKPADVNDVPYFQEPGTNGWHRLPEPQPPTDGGTPGFAPLAPSETVANGRIVALPAKVTRRAGAAHRAKRRNSGGVRTVDNGEAQARAAFASGARSKEKMAAATGLGLTASASWVRTLKAEEKARQENSQPREREQVAL